MIFFGAWKRKIANFFFYSHSVVSMQPIGTTIITSLVTLRWKRQNWTKEPILQYFARKIIIINDSTSLAWLPLLLNHPKYMLYSTVYTDHHIVQIAMHRSLYCVYKSLSDVKCFEMLLPLVFCFGHKKFCISCARHTQRHSTYRTHKS